jgi:N6-adenosine-specific RNA methylase IME4
MIEKRMINRYNKDMETIDDIIISFDKEAQPQPWEFYDFLNKNLAGEQKKLFNEIWEKTSDETFFDCSDLMTCYEKCCKYIKEHYTLKEETIKIIVKMRSYGWR